MKKSVKPVVVPALIICAIMFSSVGCGKNGNKPISGETVETGVFSALCPEGYLNIKQTDVFGEKDEEGNYPQSTDRLMFSYGAENEADAFSKPSVTISLLGPNNTVEGSVSSMEYFYDTWEEVSFTVNGEEIKGLKVTSDGGGGNEYGYDIAYVVKENRIFQVSVITASPNAPDGTGISMEDAAVQAICESIALTGEAGQ